MSRAIASLTSFAAVLVLAGTPAFAAKSPKDFLKDAIQGDNSEILLGQLAQQKASGNSKLQDFASALVTDHTQAKQQASSTAKQLSLTVPDEPTAKAKDEKDKLSKLSGAGFDREFANYMVQDHQKDIQEFQSEADANNGPASDLAKKQLPVLQKHLQMAQSLQQTGQKTASSAALGAAPSHQTPNQWRASKLAGVDIYGPDNKKVGSITDILMSRNGKAQYVVVGVGGFLGLGQKDVAIPYDQVKFTNQPVEQSGSGNSAGGTRGAVGSRTQASSGADQKHSNAYPDHGVIQMTKDQLKNAPSFEFAK